MQRRLALLSLLGCITPSLAQAQEAARAPAHAKTTAAAEAADPGNEVDELVVTGVKPRGSVIGDIPPEVTFNAADVRAMGVSSIQDLLSELTPQTTSGRGGTPVVLLNGRRISGLGELRDIPTEAIQRVEVLPEEVGLKYGYTAEQKVVNIVLRQRFHARTVEAGLAAPTAGGQTTEQLDGGTLRLNRDGRTNLALHYTHSDALFESDRNLTAAPADGLYDFAGNIGSLPAGGEIDPALSARVGAPVTVAGVPASAATRAPSLDDFVATANRANVSDLSHTRSLLPQTQSLTANSVFNRIIFDDISATLNLGGSIADSTAWLGPAKVPLVLPAGNPFSPFSQDVTLYRYVGQLQQDTRTWTAHLGGTLDKQGKDWRWNVTGNYDHAVTRTLTDRGYGLDALQTALDEDDPTANPFGGINGQPLLTDRADSTSDTGDVEFVTNGRLVRLPAGDLSTTVKLGVEGSQLNSSSRRAGVETTSDLSRGGVSGQVSFDAPLTSRKNDVLPRVGDLSANLNVAVDHLSDFGSLTTLGYGVTWTPLSPVTIIASMTEEDRAPTMQQLGNPVVTTPDTRVFDFVTGQTVDVAGVSGGNPDLKREKQQVAKLGVTWKPPSVSGLSVTADYFRTRINNPISAFPTATAATEAAFPDRFLRGPDGELLRIDSRPVNFDRQQSDQIRWGFNYSRQIGRTPPPPPGGFRRPPGDGPRPQADSAASGADKPDAKTDERPPGMDLLQGLGGGDRPPQARNDAPAPPAAGEANRAGPGDGPRGGGPGGGGRGPGGFGGGPGGGGLGATRVQFALYQTIHLREQITLTDGGPVLDLLHGDAIGSTGGEPRNEIEAQAGITKMGMGARLTATWQSATTVNGGATGAPTTLHFSDLATLNLRLFANLGARRDLVEAYPILRGSRVTLLCTNLFDAHMKVRDANGLTPIKYQADYLDPLGRSVKLSVRKLFF